MDQQLMPVPPPMFTRAMEYGFVHEKLNPDMIETLAVQLATVTVKVAEKYTSTVSEDKLMQAQRLAIGCMSLALEYESHGDPAKAFEFLEKNSLVHVFRKGFTLIDQLFKKPLTIDFLSKAKCGSEYPIDQEMLFRQICDSDMFSSWFGYAEYIAQDSKRRRSDIERNTYLWLLTKAFGKNPEARLEYLAENHLEPEAHSFMKSALYGHLLNPEIFTVMLTIRQARTISEYVSRAPLREISKSLRDFERKFPAEYRSVVRGFAYNLIETIRYRRKEKDDAQAFFNLIFYDCSLSSASDVLDYAVETTEHAEAATKKKRKIPDKKKLP